MGDFRDPCTSAFDDAEEFILGISDERLGDEGPSFRVVGIEHQGIHYIGMI